MAVQLHSKPRSCRKAAPGAALLCFALHVGGVQAQEPATLERAQASQADLAAVEAPYFKRSREGWFWYDDPRREPVRPIRPKPETPTPKPTDDAQDRDLEAFERFKRDFERSIHAATQNPSEANVARFLELYAQARAKAAVFSDTAQAVAVRMPWLDETFSGSRPMLPSAMAAYDSVTMQDRDQLLREMAESWGLYFFYRRNCAYCHIQAPQLKQFQEKYGFTVFPVTLDGGVLPDFPNSARDTGLAQTVAEALGIAPQHFMVPAVVLARPATREVVPVGFGAMNMSQMAERIALAVRVRDRGAGQGSASAVQALTGQRPLASAVDRARTDPPARRD